MFQVIINSYDPNISQFFVDVQELDDWAAVGALFRPNSDGTEVNGNDIVSLQIVQIFGRPDTGEGEGERSQRPASFGSVFATTNS